MERRWNGPWRALLVLGALVALGNVLWSARIAAFGTAAYAPSIDFEWSPTRLLLHGQDPWQQQLAGNPGGLIVLGQQPNYLHFLYLMLLPLGALGFVPARVLWLALNLGFAGYGLLRTTRYYGLSRDEQAVAAICFFASTPLSTSIANGQQALLVFVLMATALCRDKTPAPLWTGLTFFKYSFGPPLFFFALMRRGVRGAMLTLVPTVAGFLVVWAWLRRPALPLLVEPLQVAGKAVGPGFEDLMSVLQALGTSAGLRPGVTMALAYGLPMLLSAAAAWWIARRGARLPDRAVVASVALLGVLLFKHLGYDNVVLLFAGCYALRHRRVPAAKVALAVVAWFWFAVRVVQHVWSTHGAESYRLVPNFLLALLLLVLVLRVQPREDQAI